MDGRLNLLAAAVLSAALAACGGGGGGSSNDSSPAPTPPETPKGSSGDSGTLDSATYTGEKLAAFEAINAARAQTGLAPVKQNIKLDTAAQGHANYLGLNAEGGHYQTEGKPGFTGKDPWERIRNTAYQGQGSTTEVVDAEYIDSAPKPIERFLSGIYHRVPLISAETIDVGIGQEIFPDTRYTPAWDYLVTVINTGSTAPDKHIANTDGYWIWPFDNATELTVRYAESPNPAPDLSTLGYAISVTVNTGDIISAEAFTLSCAGQGIPARLITAANDINDLVPTNWVFLQPEVALPYDATCTVAFQGSSQQLGRFNKTWSFTTTHQ